VAQTLLLADDSVTIQRVIELTFADENINVVAVSDGEQAIARLDAMPPDIVLADVGMPGKNGYDVAGHVKHTPHLAHIPVVLLTGAFEPVDEAKATALGCDGVLAKPFEPQMVISRVKELLARPAPAGERSEHARAGESAPAIEPAPAAESPSLAIVELKSAVPPAAASAANGDAAKLDEYFDQLDSAFARFTSERAVVKPADLLPAIAPEAPPADVDWFGPPVVGEAAAAFDPLLSWQSPPPAPDTLEPAAPVEAREPAAYTQATAVSEPVPQRAIASGEPLPVMASVSRDLPPLGDAFAAILAAEQSGLAAPSAWPPPASMPAAPIGDDVVDRVSRRVIEQLTDRVVRDAVADAVSGIAERLVREEIERIKKAIE
jgi:CheY-like chemotaxis protein